MRRTVFGFLKFAVAGLLIYWCVATGKIELSRLAGVLVGWRWMVLGVALALIGGCVGVLRWRVLLYAQGIKVSFFSAFRLTYIGFFFNLVIPGATGGDVVKAVYVARGQSKKAEAVTTVILDRFVGLYTIVVLSLFGVLYKFSFLWNYPGKRAVMGLTKTQALVLMVFVCFVIGTATVALLLSKRLKQSEGFDKLLGKIPLGGVLRSAYEATYLYRQRKEALAVCLIYSFGSQIIAIISCLCFGLVVGDTLSPGSYFYLIPLGLVINGIPIAPMGWGIGEIGFSELFALVGSPEGGNLAALLHIVQFLMNLLGAVFFILGSPAEFRRVREEVRHSQEDQQG